MKQGKIYYLIAQEIYNILHLYEDNANSVPFWCLSDKEVEYYKWLFSKDEYAKQRIMAVNKLLESEEFIRLAQQAKRKVEGWPEWKRTIRLSKYSEGFGTKGWIKGGEKLEAFGGCMNIKRMDFVKYGSNIFLVTKQDDGLYLWDFKAWLVGYYDAYISLKNLDEFKLKVIGNLEHNPELLPKECEGYNGEPNVEILEHIYP